MRSPRLVCLLALAALVPGLSCGRPKTFDVRAERRQPPVTTTTMQPRTPTWGYRASVDRYRWLRAVETAGPPTDGETTVRVLAPPAIAGQPAVSTTPTTPPSTGGVWACIANAETGGVPAMGPTYWTVFGMVTDIIQDYGSLEQQAAVFGGYADFATQLDIASRFANDHGFGGWGYLTREKCGL